MYELHIQGKELWDEDKEEFYTINSVNLRLEHSLASISKWEAKYHKPFLTTQKTGEETFEYIKMMVLGKMPEDDKCFYLITQEQLAEINKYINDSMTATIFSEEDEKEFTNKVSRSKFVTAEEIYYWMTAQNIPFECQYWHLNKLITLIKICAIYNKPKDKKNKRMTSSDLAARRAKMEAARKKWKG